MEEFQHAIDDRAETFLQIGDVARTIAERHCDVEVDILTHVRWREVMGLLREVDTLADESSDTHEEVMEKLIDFSIFTDRYPALSPGNIDEETRQAMLNRTRRILKLGTFISEADTPRRYISLRVKEGIETAGYLADAATPFVAEQPNFHELFMPVMESMAVSANLLDSLTDAQMDRKAGKLNLEPNSEYYRLLVRNTWVRGGLGSRALWHTPVMKEFAVMSWNRLVNRVKHRGSDTTSLNIFRDK